MYRHCIFCSSEFGANEAIEEFPVGRSLAFDAWKGRLWVVCGSCARWNLSPIEERWEAVEAAEKHFVDARLRVQSENIGLARLPDGTRLIRVGQALPGELAAWRYGGQLIQRRRRYFLLAGAAGLGFAAWTGLSIAGVVGSGGGMWWMMHRGWERRRNRKVVHRIDAETSPSGRETLVRRWHVRSARLTEGDAGDLVLHLPDTHLKDPVRRRAGQWASTDLLTLDGVVARTVLGRGMIHVNTKGASRRHVEDAVRLLSDANSAEEYLRRTAREGVRLTKPQRGAGRPQWQDVTAPVLGREHALALEMALHEETERQALEGELSLLESAWREAEEIAAIADRLPDDLLERVRGQSESGG